MAKCEELKTTQSHAQEHDEAHFTLVKSETEKLQKQLVQQHRALLDMQRRISEVEEKIVVDPIEELRHARGDGKKVRSILKSWSQSGDHHMLQYIAGQIK